AVLERDDRVVPPIDQRDHGVGGTEVDPEPHEWSLPIWLARAMPLSVRQPKRAGRASASWTRARYRSRGTATQPSSSRCEVSTCTSKSVKPRSRSLPAVAAKATLDAPVTRWNIDSPANSPPMAMP